MTPRALLAVPALLLALSACGGGDDEGGGALSKEEFVSQANEICTGANERLDGIEDPATADDLTRVLQEGAPVFEEAVTALRDLEAPEADAESLRTGLLDPLRAQADALTEAAASPDPATATEQLSSAEGVDIDTEAVTGYGLTACEELSLT